MLNEKIINYVKSHKNAFIVLAVFIALIIIGIIIRAITPEVPTLQKLPQTPYRNSVEVGKISVDQFISQVGTPSSVVAWSEKPGTNILNYKSTSKWNTQVFANTTTSTIELIIQQHSPTDTFAINQATQTYPEPPILLFNYLSENGYYLQIYPSRGIGFVAPYQKGTVFQTLYFTPVPDTKTFLENYGSLLGYKETPDFDSEEILPQ